MVLAATLLEPFTEFCLLTLITTWALHTLISLAWWIFIPLNLIFWLWIDLDVYKSLGGQPVPTQDQFLFILSWALRELLALPIWMVAVTGDVVEWRGVSYRVLQNGEVERADSSRENSYSHTPSNLIPRAIMSLWRPKYAAVPTVPTAPGTP